MDEHHSSNSDDHRIIFPEKSVNSNGNNSSATIEPSSENSSEEDELTGKFTEAMRQLRRYDGPYEQKIKQKLLPQVREYFQIDEPPISVPEPIKV